MKKMTLMVLVILAMGLFSANFTFAEDDVEVDVSNESTNNVNATGGNAQQDQNQDQNQWQGQNQNACATGGNATGGQGGAGGKGGEGGDADANSNSNAEINHSGNADVRISGVKGGESSADADASANIGDTTANNKTVVKGVDGKIENTYNNITKRSHITATPGVSGSFVNAPTVTAGSWQELICQPLFKIFTMEQLEAAADGESVEVTLRQREVSDYDENPVIRMDWIPVNANLLGEFIVKGEERGLLAPLSKAILRAKKETNAHYVFVWFMSEEEFKNSGFSIGSGAAGGRVWGPNLDATAGALALGGLIGTTTASSNKKFVVRVWAFSDCSNEMQPEGVEICGLTISAPTTKTEIVEEEISSQKSACDPQPIISRIKQFEEGTKYCPNNCLNNESLRKQLGDAYLDLFYCVGNQEALAKAIAEYEKAEKNFLEGREPNGTRTSTLQGAQEILYKAHYNSALAIRELHGRDAEISFAQFKKLSERGDHTMPTEKNDIKR